VKKCRDVEAGDLDQPVSDWPVTRGDRSVSSARRVKKVVEKSSGNIAENDLKVNEKFVKIEAKLKIFVNICLLTGHGA